MSVVAHNKADADAMAVGLVGDAIRRYRFRFAHEDELQAGLAAALVEEGFHVEREVRLDGRSRIDLIVERPHRPERVGIEVKVGGTVNAMHKQVARYLTGDHLVGLVLVTTRARHDLPRMIGGKPVDVVNLSGMGL